MPFESTRPPDIVKEDGFTYSFCTKKNHYVPRALFGTDQGQLANWCMACAAEDSRKQYRKNPHKMADL